MWAALKSLVAQRSFRNSPVEGIPDEHYHELYELRDQARLPPRVEVFTAKVAWSEDHAQAGFFRLNALKRVGAEDREEMDGYLLTFSALDLAVQVARFYWDDEAEFLGRPSLAGSVARIWPPGDSFAWPPGPALTARGLEAWAGELRRP